MKYEEFVDVPYINPILLLLVFEEHQHTQKSKRRHQSWQLMSYYFVNRGSVSCSDVANVTGWPLFQIYEFTPIRDR